VQLAKLKMYLLNPELSVQFRLCETAVPALVELVEFKEYVGDVESAGTVVVVVVAGHPPTKHCVPPYISMQ
jgi:hypothetical protein